MAIRKDDWPEIDQRITEALAALKPQGFKRAIHSLMRYGPLYGLIALFLVPWAIVATLGIALISRRDADTRFQTKSEDFQSATEKRLNGIDTALVTLRMLVIASQPARMQNQQAADDLLMQAKQNVIPPIPEDAVEQAGESFIDAGGANPGVWQTALRFVSYRSFSNSKQMPPVFSGQPYMIALGSKPDPIIPGAPTFIVIQGPGITHLLDNKAHKNVIFKQVLIQYHGGPTVLDHTFFQDCTFDITTDPKGKDLARAILKSFVPTLTL